MSKKEKRYTAEFRAQAVRLCEESEKSIAEVARELGVGYQTLYEWMRKAGKTKQSEASGSAQSSHPSSDELRRLRRELDEVKMERDFLKKAAAFFAQMKK